MDLSGKRIIVTGAATGIGRSAAVEVARRGARVAAIDIADDPGISTASEINNAGGQARYWHVDVADEAAVAGGVAAAEAWMGGIDVLLHAAGILQGAMVNIEDFPEAIWDRVVDVNLKGAFLFAKHVAPAMRRGRGGAIVLVASGAGVSGGSSSYAYGSSKGGVHGLAMVLAKRLAADGIRVNDLCPGAIETPLKVAAEEESLRNSGDLQKHYATMASLGAPQGVANVLAFLAGDDADYVRGAIFTR